MKQVYWGVVYSKKGHRFDDLLIWVARGRLELPTSAL